MDSHVIHLKDISKPKPTENDTEGDGASGQTENLEEPNEATFDSEEPWPEQFTTSLSAFLSLEKISELKQLYIAGLNRAVTDQPQPSGKKGRARGRKHASNAHDTAQVSSDVRLYLFHSLNYIIHVPGHGLLAYILKGDTDCTASNSSSFI